jgi:hypothetical protein
MKSYEITIFSNSTHRNYLGVPSITMQVFGLRVERPRSSRVARTGREIPRAAGIARDKHWAEFYG